MTRHGRTGEPARLRVAVPPTARPLMIFDGECAFCRLWIDRWSSMTGDRVDYAASQDVAARFPEIPPEVFARSVVLVDTTGEARTGAEAVLTALDSTRSGRLALGIYRHAPGVAMLAEMLYRIVASNRRSTSRVTRLLWGPTVLRPTYDVARCLYLRAIGLVYLVAFVSLWTQIDGLIGSRGILPVGEWLDAVARQAGPERFWHLPTLGWIDPSDTFLHVQCGAGALLAACVLAGWLPAFCLAICWALYLSLTVAGSTFLGFQWDNLLLEAGFLAVLIAPMRRRCRLGCAPGPPRLAVVLIQFLAFRLVFSSGVMKLASGDPVWRDLTALTYHYQTQCLPPWTAWYAHHLPLWAQKLSCAGMFAIELGAPWLIAAPRRLRHLGAALLVMLQLAILVTGNYGFFNLLSLALCLMLLDDTVWPVAWRHQPAEPGRGPRRRPAGWPLIALASVILVIATVRLAQAFRTPIRWPAPVAWLDRTVAPLRTVNRYGLFSDMTTTRNEIVVEGSRDAVTWLPYEFRWKPGDPDARPRFTTPHMPRLDWQMWFAALGDCRDNPWFQLFMRRLLEGSPPVTSLLARDPFAGSPPLQVRAILYEYEFTGGGEAGTAQAATSWWRRRRLGVYCPALPRSTRG